MADLELVHDLEGDLLLECAQKALSAPTALPRSPTALFKRFISPNACRHTPDTWTRYGCVPTLDLVKYTKCGARDTRLSRHPDVPDTATRLHTVKM